MHGCYSLKIRAKTMKIQTKCMQDDIDALQSQISSSRATRTHRRRSNGRASGGKSVDDPCQGSPDLSIRHSVGVCGGAVDETVNSATVNSNNELTDDASDVDCSRTEDPTGEGMAFSQFENNTVIAETSPMAPLVQLILVSMRMSQKLFTGQTKFTVVDPSIHGSLTQPIGFVQRLGTH